MQAILGAGGSIGNALAIELLKFTNEIRIVGRNPQKVNQTDQLFTCDLTNAAQVKEAVKNCKVVYLTAGLEYKYKVWKEQWPVIMKNTLEACKVHNCKLVFFDNVYMYDCAAIPAMTENTQYKPCSNKGQVRKQIAEMLENAWKTGEVLALIARSADFYGPGIKNSVLQETIYKPLKEGKTANCLISDNFVHSYTYTPDAARATALLGNTETAYRQVWHLPTAKRPLNNKEWVNAFAKALNQKPKYRIAGKGMIKLMGWFNSAMREMVEMLYQYDRDYVFDSSKFEMEFSVSSTSYLQGIEQIVAQDKSGESI